MNRDLIRSKLDYASRRSILDDLIFPFENFIIREGKQLMANGFSSDLEEDKENYYIKAELPGINKDEIELEADSNKVVIHAEKKQEREESDKKNHFSEITYGSFSRSFSFSHSIDTNNVKAFYENGILKIKLKKVDNSKLSRINIE